MSTFTMVTPKLTPGQISRMDEDRSVSVIAVGTLFIVLCTVAIGLRFYARYNRRLGIELDDWSALAALLFVILYCVSCVIALPFGMGKHVWAVDPTRIWRILQIGLFNALIYFTTHFFIKLSILAFYKRIFTLRILWFRWCLIAIAIYNGGWFISSFFAALFQCYPPQYFWEQQNPALAPPPAGTCGAHNAPLVISTSALNTFGDILIFALPLAMLSKIQLNRANKLSLLGVFATGAFAIIAGIIRLTSTLSAVGLGADVTWITADIYMWTAVEGGVGLICACMPTIGPLLGLAGKKISGHVMEHTTRSQAHKVHGTPRSDAGSWNAKSMVRKSTVLSSSGSYSASSDENLELKMQSPRSIIRTDEFSVGRSSRKDDTSFETDVIIGTAITSPV
ncbi:hypothetical protein GMORB2_1790 [Geosmithia morbida]|uniref:Rhodopsin domain-containing protein n=1 Tax=Geosmithia morbida TaxID=1094350 RepID=A0A9P4YSH1_9HYPO|nr:uncharacterized protein GMORB2_1790 [Geosmithia morbida]KAF4121950.1 hypothetical protein GMORB2_1790 [Geosmithia morbida]